MAYYMIAYDTDQSSNWNIYATSVYEKKKSEKMCAKVMRKYGRGSFNTCLIISSFLLFDQKKKYGGRLKIFFFLFLLWFVFKGM